MKKVCTLAVVAAMAVSAQAVSISWGSGGAVNVVDGGVPTLLNASSLAGAGSIALFYLGNTAGTLLTAETVDIGDAIATSSMMGSKSPAGESTFAAQKYTGFSIAAEDIAAGDVFAVFFLNGSGGVSQFFTDATLTTAFDSSYTFTGAETDITGGIVAMGNAGGTGMTYVPVPEPATAALALAGLAMLIRRRK